MERRKKYHEEINPNTIRDSLINDFKTCLSGVEDTNIQELVYLTYHPEGKKGKGSYGENVYFQTLLAIADQLFIYQEFLQDLSYEIDSIVPVKAEMTELSAKKEKIPLHLELQQKHRDKLLKESPNKYAVFNLIDGKRSLTDLWTEFNELERKEGNQVSKQYISQVVKELEAVKLIEVQRQGKEKIPRRIEGSTS